VNIAMLVFERITVLDVVGPYEVLVRLPGATVQMVGLARGVVRSDNGACGIAADVALEEVSRADVLVVPGGFGTRALEKDERVKAWIRAIDQTTTVTASVCTGALVLGAAGLLQGRRANTHWALRERLREHGAIPEGARVVRDGKYASAAGVSAGIDLALTLAAELASPELAQAIQLGIEYDPAPPFDAGSPERAPAAIRDAVLARIRDRDATLRG